jgi:hypothetical protein
MLELCSLIDDVSCNQLASISSETTVYSGTRKRTNRRRQKLSQNGATELYSDVVQSGSLLHTLYLYRIHFNTAQNV